MRCGILSDIHGNLDALEAVLAHAGTCDAWFCLGDTVGYGPQPNECVKRVSSLCRTVLIGNHDLAAIDKLDIRWFNPYARAAAEWTRSVLDDETKAFLEALPETASEPEWDVTFAHGSLTDPPRDYITQTYEARRNFKLLDTAALFIGHSHLSQYFVQKVGETSCDGDLFSGTTRLSFKEGYRYIVNCGSVGQPRDRDPRAAYGLFDPEERVVEIYRVEYDIASVQAKMEALDLPSLLIERLGHGF